MENKALAYAAIGQLAQMGYALTFNISNGVPSVRQMVEDSMYCFKMIEYIASAPRNASPGLLHDRVAFAIRWLRTVRVRHSLIVGLDGPRVPTVDELDLTIKAADIPEAA